MNRESAHHHEWRPFSAGDVRIVGGVAHCRSDGILPFRGSKLDCPRTPWIPAGVTRTGVASMSGLVIGLSVLYLVLLFTVAVITFRKGHWVLGLIGFFIPVLWLVGAVLPARRGSPNR